ncbi:high choriolytic enzyme 1-like isoform X1 [Polypterus senegalus]|uniref:high choriolytic enzyme 1-like isoform X1 n=1 Tax=Polypterus senegalus TaxID=55291 RepID=UPI00196283D1|nr:high choriolytic enzyme 1-like isoform X1 [Polypterus senegalus]
MPAVGLTPLWCYKMNSIKFFLLLGFLAHIAAFPVQNSTGLNEEAARFKRGFSAERLAESEMTAMDRIQETNENEFLVNPPPEGTTFREGDIAVSQRRSPISCFARSCLWPKSVDGFVYVPYNLSSQYNDIEKMAIETGMQDIANGTCIRFVPRSHESNYLNIQSKTGCWSFLGLNGGAQPMSLQAPGCTWSGVAAHELMHALGFVHEQSRIDRDRYITILWENILKDREFNFDKYKTNNLDTPYDYGSLMHFGNYKQNRSTQYAYSEDGLPTILPKSNINVQIGQRFGPSPTDKLKINKLYKCAV